MRCVWRFGLFAVVILAVEAAPVRADLAAGPWPWQWSRPVRPTRYLSNADSDSASTPQPTPQVGAVDPATGTPYPPPAPTDPPKRTGPFRSCGSGMGLGLAGIGLAWAMLWLGNRCAGRISRK